MEIFSLIFNACYSILRTHIILFGYSISLWNVVMYFMVGAIILFIFFKLSN